MSNIIELNSLENHGKPSITRADAKAQGLQTFYTGKPCNHGHMSERYVSNGNCAACKLENNAKLVASGEFNAASKRYRENNPDRRAATNGWQNAKARGVSLPFDFSTSGDLIAATVHLYQAARQRTDEARSSFVVDHIVPLARGGQHHPSNLRVVSGAFNRAKGSLTDQECLDKIADGSWKGPTDQWTLLMLIRSVAKEREVVAINEKASA